jgi:hypothetical protein
MTYAASEPPRLRARERSSPQQRDQPHYLPGGPESKTVTRVKDFYLSGQHLFIGKSLAKPGLRDAHVFRAIR